MILRIFLLMILVGSGIGLADPVAEQALKRLGPGKNGEPLPVFADRKFVLTGEDVVVFVGQENLVRDQKAGELRPC